MFFTPPVREVGLSAPATIPRAQAAEWGEKQFLTNESQRGLHIMKFEFTFGRTK